MYILFDHCTISQGFFVLYIDTDGTLDYIPEDTILKQLFHPSDDARGREVPGDASVSAANRGDFF